MDPRLRLLVERTRLHEVNDLAFCRRTAAWDLVSGGLNHAVKDGAGDEAAEQVTVLVLV